MESAKRSIVFRSLQFRLTLIFCILGVLGAFIASIFSYYSVKHESLQLVDDEISQIASAAINYDFLIPRRWEKPQYFHERYYFKTPNGLYSIELGRAQSNQAPIPSVEDISEHKFDIIIAPLVVRPHENIFIPYGTPDGFYTVLVSDERVRMYIATKSTGQRFIVARSLDVINDIAKAAFVSALILFCISLSIYVPVAIFITNFTFKTIKRLAESLKNRGADDLSEIKDKGYIPSELDSFIAAINNLFAKVQDSMNNQRLFIANAAHEMRTPLTALSLQAQSLENEDLPAKAREKLKSLLNAIEREKELMTSLLTLAKNQSIDKNTIVKSAFNVKDLYLDILEQLGNIADNKNIDFGVDGQIDYEVVSSYKDVYTIISNLCSNAIKYTQDYGKVDLIVQDNEDNIELIVKDNGPGIDKDALAHVFEPFYRVGSDTNNVVGTGLGLAIAQASAHKIDAKIIMMNNENQPGLRASLLIPKAKNS